MTMRIKAPKKIKASVSVPRANPLGTRRSPRGFLHVSQPSRPKSQARVYTKAAARQDPSMFTSVGFGDTGLSGES